MGADLNEFVKKWCENYDEDTPILISWLLEEIDAYGLRGDLELMLKDRRDGENQVRQRLAKIVKRRQSERSREDQDAGNSRRQNGMPPEDSPNDIITDADCARWDATMLHAFARSRIGKEIRRFRKENFGGTVSMTHFDQVMINLINQHRGMILTEGETIVTLKGSFYDELEDLGALVVPAASALGQAYRLGQRISDSFPFPCSLNHAVLFLFTQKLPFPYITSVMQEVPSWSQAFALDYNIRPIVIRVMPWIAPTQVADLLADYQSRSWIGRPKMPSLAALQMCRFVRQYIESRCWDDESMSRSQWVAIRSAWEKSVERGENMNPPNRKNGWGEKFPSEYKRVSNLLLATSEDKRRNRKPVSMRESPEIEQEAEDAEPIEPELIPVLRRTKKKPPTG